MKKRLVILLTLSLLFSFNTTFWAKIEKNPITIQVVEKNQTKELTRWEALTFYWNYFKEIPESYKYISLNFKWVTKDTDLYKALQKLIYLDLLENTKINIYSDKKVNALTFYKLWEKILWTPFINLEETNSLKKRNAIEPDMRRVINSMRKVEEKTEIDDFKIDWSSKELDMKQAIFIDAYNTILESHYDRNTIDEVKLWDSAISWVAKWANDKYTAYFPPVENKNFQEGLNWEYEWIWSYVDMENPWVVKIVSPISWSPSQKAWLKWWDIVTKVDWKEITIKNSLQEVVSWIKWPAWTNVVLTIIRDKKELEITVVREKIIIKDIEFELINDKTFVISVKSFWETVSAHFELALNELKKHNNVNKVIIDLRNNWWWYLEEVSDILSHFVPEWEITAYVEYLSWDKEYKSRWYDLIDFSKYKIILLQNSWTASASEIMIWTIKDYYPSSQTIGETTYWKWSVQTIKSYTDWSSLKYTIAKWFTWKSRTWIDWVGIKPDIELEQDLKNINNDNVLNKAINIR